jgi:hypothetical protein
MPLVFEFLIFFGAKGTRTRLLPSQVSVLNCLARSWAFAAWSATRVTRTREATSNRNSTSQLVTRSPFRSSSSSSVTHSRIGRPGTHNSVRTKLQGMSVRLLAS